MVPIRTKTTEDVIYAYLKHVFFIFGGVSIFSETETMNSPASYLQG